MPGPSDIPRGNVANTFELRVPNTNVAPVAINTSEERPYTVPGLRVGDVCTAIKPSFQAGLTIAHARVSALNTLQLTFVNNTAGTIAPAAETYLLSVLRSAYDAPLTQLPTAIA